MKWKMHLPERPFRAIKNGTKKIEGRVSSSASDRYSKIKSGDEIIFELEPGTETVNVKVGFVHHYPSVRSMLESEGVESVLSSLGNIEQGIESYHSIPHYRENVKKFGIYAIGVTPIN